MTFVAKTVHLRQPHFVLIATSDRSTAALTTAGRLVATQQKEVGLGQDNLEEHNLEEHHLEVGPPRLPTTSKPPQEPHFVLIATSDRSTAARTTAGRLVAMQQKEVGVEERNMEEHNLEDLELGSPRLLTRSKPQRE